MPARRAAFRLARQSAGRAARDDRGGGRSRRALYLGDPDRHRRDTRRTDRGAAGAPRTTRALQPYPGNHRPEFLRQAGHEDGGRGGARSRRSSLDHRDRAADFRRGDEHPGAAQSRGRRVTAPRRGRHQRLGRCLAGDARPRKSGATLARARGAGARDRRRRQGAGRAAGDLSALCRRTRALARPRATHVGAARFGQRRLRARR